MKLEVEEARGILVLRSVKGDRPKRLVPLRLLCAYAFLRQGYAGEKKGIRNVRNICSVGLERICQVQND